MCHGNDPHRVREKLIHDPKGKPFQPALPELSGQHGPRAGIPKNPVNPVLKLLKELGASAAMLVILGDGSLEVGLRGLGHLDLHRVIFRRAAATATGATTSHLEGFSGRHCLELPAVEALGAQTDLPQVLNCDLRIRSGAQTRLEKLDKLGALLSGARQGLLKQAVGFV